MTGSARRHEQQAEAYQIPRAGPTRPEWIARLGRKVVPSVELVPMQFRMPPTFVKAFKQAALDRDMKLNELLQFVFDNFMKTTKKD